MRSTLILLVLLISLVLITCSEKEQLFTLLDPQTPCTIVMDLGPYASAEEARDAYANIDWFDNKKRDDNISQIALAATELRSYLSLMVNVPATHLPIVDDDSIPEIGNLIILGSPPNPALRKIVKAANRKWRKNKKASDQALRIDSFYRKNYRGMILSGKTATGVLYAVYDLLDGYGVRWFAPEDGGEFVPRMTKIDIYSLHRFFDPQMKIRGFWVDARRPPNIGNKALYEWLGRNRINLFWNREEDIAALKQRGILLNTGRQDTYENLLRPEYNYRYNHPNISDDEQFPMDPYLVSDQFQGDVNGDKHLSYGEAHPEWFNGLSQNDSTHTRADDARLCLSNTEAVKEFSQIIVDKLAYGGWQTCDIVDIWEPKAWCGCEKCQNMGNSADKLLYLIYHINQAVEGAREKGELHRPVFVHGYIRRFTEAPPQVTLPDNFDYSNVALFLFTGPRCYNHYIISPGCTAINIWYARSLLEWQKEECAYKGDLYIAENYNADYIHSLPATHSEMMRLDIPAYLRLGISGINFQHVRFHDNGVQKLLNYQFARESWNNDVAVDTLRNEFFAYYYQDAGELIRDYYEKIELAMATVSTWAYYLPHRAEYLFESNDSSAAQIPFIIDERFAAKDSASGVDFRNLWENTYHNIYEARFIFEQAEKLSLPPLIKQHVSELRHQLEYTELTIKLYDNIISYITTGDEDYLKEEAIIRMKENMAKLKKMTIFSPLQGMSNAYEATGVQHLVDVLNKDFKSRQ